MGSTSKQKSNQSSSGVNSSNSVNSGLGVNYGTSTGGNFGFTNGGSQNTSGSSNFGSSSGQSTSSGGSFNSSSSQGSSSSTQDIWGAQSPFLQQVYEAAANGNADAQAQIQQLQPGIQDQMGSLSQAGQNAYNQQLAGGNAANLGPSQVAGMQGNSLQQQMLNGYDGANPYMAGMKDQIAQDAQRLKQQNLGSLDARAAAAGMSGSSGYRNQVGDMMENVDENALNAMTNLGYQANNQAVQDRIRLSGAADQYNMQAAGAGDQYAMQQAGMMDQTAANALGQTNALQQSAMNQFNPAMMGQQSAALFGQTIGGPTTLTNSQSQNTSSSTGGSSQESQSTNSSMNRGNSFGQGTSFNNGMNMGFNNSMNMGANMSGGVANSFGQNSSQGNSSGSSFGVDGKGVGALIGAFSDARLKHNIRPAGSVDGVNMYEWDWRDDAPVTSPMTYGVLAQEVAETHPEAAKEHESGYLMVDYSRLGKAGEAAIARMGG